MAGRAGAAVLGVLAVLAAPAAAGERPARVVSLNVCTDQLAMMLAAPGQLVSVSSLASDPRYSAMAEEAAAYPPNFGGAEEVFLMRPDLVLAGQFTARAAVDMLRRLGVKVVDFAPAASLDDVPALIRQTGEALGRQAEAEAMAERFEAERAALAAERSGDRPVAALHHANSYTAGPGTLADAIVEAAGMENLAGQLGLAGLARLPLEVLVAGSPDLLVTSRRHDGAARAEESFDHPALAAIRREAGRAAVSDREWICGTPFVLDAVRALGAARAGATE